LGGCFRTENVILRIFEDVTIKNSFSGKTTVGIKVIDEKKVIEKMTNDLSLSISSKVI
jgi:hypothetical protein